MLAQTASNRTNRVVLLQMAATWLKLAERALATAAKQIETQELTAASVISQSAPH
jgi:hypothetical protein